MFTISYYTGGKIAVSSAAPPPLLMTRRDGTPFRRLAMMLRPFVITIIMTITIIALIITTNMISNITCPCHH